MSEQKILRDTGHQDESRKRAINGCFGSGDYNHLWPLGLSFFFYFILIFHMKDENRPGYTKIIRWAYKHPKTGRWIRAKHKPFVFWVKSR